MIQTYKLKSMHVQSYLSSEKQLTKYDQAHEVPNVSSKDQFENLFSRTDIRQNKILKI